MEEDIDDLTFEFAFTFGEFIALELSFKKDISVMKFRVFVAALARSTFIGGTLTFIGGTPEENVLRKKSLATSILVFLLFLKLVRGVIALAL